MTAMVAVYSCIRSANDGTLQAIRETFGKRCPWPMYFFIGQPGEMSLGGMTPAYLEDCKRWKFLGEDGSKGKQFLSSQPLGRGPLPDEIVLDCPDAYAALPWKKRGIARFQAEHDFGHCLQLSDDAYVFDWVKMERCGYEKHAYSGPKIDGVEDGNPYFSGGTGYWISLEAAKLLLEGPLDSWAEDYWVGSVMAKAGTRPVALPRYSPVKELSCAKHGDSSSLAGEIRSLGAGQ
jgi:hypothetical protein